MQVFSPELISPVVPFSRIFLYIRNTFFQEHLRVFVIHFLLRCVNQEFTRFICLFKKSDVLYLFPTNWLLSIVIDKFTIIEFSPFSLVKKGAYVIFGKICLYVKSYLSFLLFHTALFLSKLNAQFL